MKKIFDMLSEVRSIAKQTNLLALNAAIEAARAGEVRKLSCISNNFNEQIRGMIHAAQSKIVESRELVEKTVS